MLRKDPRKEKAPRERPGALADEPRESKRGSAFRERQKARERWLAAGHVGFPGDDVGASNSRETLRDNAGPRKSQKGADGGPVRLGSSEVPFTANADTVAEVPWLSSGLRVRIVDETGPLQDSHLKKGFVRKVDDAALLADVDVDGGMTLHKVPQHALETVVSKGCLRVEVVRGPHRGVIVDLLERDPKLNIAIVRTKSTQTKHGDGDDRLELSLDDVCEFKQ
mmetsp:Transcript_19514/g.26206  ORF Transcript_19514/g.26206 Transcript_19514/m.26206 type:complete len:223 (-) Transcript_19514:85-753(-)